jgi:hypothetical protein
MLAGCGGDYVSRTGCLLPRIFGTSIWRSRMKQVRLRLESTPLGVVDSNASIDDSDQNSIPECRSSHSLIAAVDVRIDRLA